MGSAEAEPHAPPAEPLACEDCDGVPSADGEVDGGPDHDGDEAPVMDGVGGPDQEGDGGPVIDVVGGPDQEGDGAPVIEMDVGPDHVGVDASEGVTLCTVEYVGVGASDGVVLLTVVKVRVGTSDGDVLLSGENVGVSRDEAETVELPSTRVRLGRAEALAHGVDEGSGDCVEGADALDVNEVDGVCAALPLMTERDADALGKAETLSRGERLNDALGDTL